MILGIGTDILKIQRIRDNYENGVDSFIEKVYTDNEREQAAGRSDPVLYFATRFAGKEAVFKCFGIEYNTPDFATQNFNINHKEIRLNEIEILGTEMAQPKVLLSGTCSEIAAIKGIKNIQISLSYDTDYAVAFAIAQD
jgi:holo-[acyl-carrier protein] synthase